MDKTYADTVRLLLAVIGATNQGSSKLRMAEIPISVRLAGQAITIGAEACYQHPARVGARVAARVEANCSI